MGDKTQNPKKSKIVRKQPDLRQFMLKKMKSQGTSQVELDNSSTFSQPSQEEEWLYDVELLPHDPGKRKNIMDYAPNQRNAVRRAYILKKPCQPKTHDFPQRDVGGMRRFSVSWFQKYDWLEYSIEKDAAFCFVCYLFKNDGKVSVGGDAFVYGGFRAWNKPDRFEKHVGGVKSAHNLAYEKYVNLRDSKEKSIVHVFDNASDMIRSEYETRLKAVVTTN